MENQKWPKVASSGKSETQPHLLLIGGDRKKDFPQEKFNCGTTHVDTRKKNKKIDFTLRKYPTLAIIFTDYINHVSREVAVKKCKSLGIPYIQTSGGLSRAVEEADRAGHAWVRTCVKNGRKDTKLPPPSPPRTAVLDIRPSGHHRSIKLVRIGDRSFEIIKNRKGKWSLVIKREILDEAVSFANDHGLGKGIRGSLTAREAGEIVKMFEIRYGFSEYEILVSTTNVAKNVNYMRGTMTPAQAARMDGKKVVKEKRSESKKEASIAIATKLNLKRASVQGSAVEVFLSDMSQVMNSLIDINTKQGILYETIADLKMENTSYIEQIDQQAAEIKDLKTEVKRWKKMATKEND